MVTKYQEKSGSMLFNIIIAVIGLILVFKPELGVNFVRWYVGILLILGGIFSFYSYSKDPLKPKSGIFKAGGLGILGIVFLVSSSFSNSAFGIILMLWMFIDAIFKALAAFSYKKIGVYNWWILGAFSLVSLVFGLYILTDLSRGVESIIFVVGFFMMTNAIGAIVDTLLFKKNN